MVNLVRYRIELRDLDGFCHLSHVKVLELVEVGRIALYNDLTGARTVEEIDLIMGEVTVRYERPGALYDEVVIGSAVSAIGETSIAFDCEIWKDDPSNPVTLVRARTICIYFDHEREVRMRVPTTLRAAAGESLPEPASLPRLVDAKAVRDMTLG